MHYWFSGPKRNPVEKVQIVKSTETLHSPLKSPQNIEQSVHYGSIKTHKKESFKYILKLHSMLTHSTTINSETKTEWNSSNLSRRVREW